MRNKLVTIFGGGGFLGRYIAQALLQRGARIRIAQRDPQAAMHIKPLGNLGQVQLVPANVTRPATLAHALEGADMVVNLVGSFNNMEAIQHLGAANVAQAAKKAKIPVFLHMSAIGADAESAALYGRSKAAGEAAVRKAYKNAIILRPSVVFGREDQFINRFANLIRMAPMVPVIGGNTKFQPVFVGDVAKAVASCLDNVDEHGGQVYELGGPQVYSMLELNEWIADAIGRKANFVAVPDFVARVMATATGWLPGAPITLDQFRMLQNDNIVTARDGLEACGVAPTSLDTVAHDWLHIYRKHGRFAGRTSAA